MSNEKREVDVVVIGAGSAGLVARRAALAEGASVLLCDGGVLGTTCARVGCMPSKLVLAAANAARDIRRAPGFGVHSSAPEVDGPAVMQRVRDERDRFVSFTLKEIDTMPDTHFLAENVQLVAPGVMRSERGVEIHYRAAVIATGTTPNVPKPLDALARTLETSDSIFEIPDLPKRLAVIGTGPIGLELGQAFAGLGVEVTLIGINDQLGVLRSQENLETYRDTLRDELTLYQNTKITAATESERGAQLTLAPEGEPPVTLEFDMVLLAAGRSANYQALGLSKVGIDATHPRDLNIDADRLQIGDHPLFIAGDANGIRPVLHEASDEGRIAGENAARLATQGPEGVRCYHRRVPLSIMFTEPQGAQGGQLPGELEENTYATGTASFYSQGRARVDLQNKGTLHIYGRKSDGRLLGFEMLGPDAEHIAHLLSWAIQTEMNVLEALDMPFYHPVTVEGLRTALQRLAKGVDIRRSSRLRAKECAPTEEF